MTEEELRSAIVEAVRKVQVWLGPNGKVMVESGRPIYLNFTESHKVADAVLGVLKSRQAVDPGPLELAKYIESQPMSVVQAAFRRMGLSMSFILVDESEDPVLCGGCGNEVLDGHTDVCEELDRGLFHGMKAELPDGFPEQRIHDFLWANQDQLKGESR